ncbi:transporter substrate-binding domain-containing protein [Paenibacillus apiarius]|uniref:transporter substrate-binding domain-containing protein n=1 Tax=Paenibacillus apiarius TaxID=46240 RepID=UPI003B3B0D75
MKALKIVTVCTLLMSLLIGCGAKSDRYDTVMENKKLVLGVSADYPPFEFHATVNGKDEIVGFDIELAKEIAKDLGVPLEIKDMKFDSVVASVPTGKIDIAISGMDPTPDRQKAMDFSKPYYVAEAGVIVRAEDKDKYKSPEDMKGLKIGVQKGSTFEDVIGQIPEAKAELLNKVNDLVLALETKRIDAVLVEKPVAKSYEANRKELAVADVVLKPASDGYAVGMRKDSPKLVEAVNKTIDRLQSEGKLDEFITQATQLAESGE